MRKKSCMGKFWGPAIIFLLLSLLFHHPVWTRGKVISPNDISLQHLPFRAQAPEDLGRPNNYLLEDQSLQFHVYRNFLKTQVSKGVWPLWNPYILSGTPFSSNIQSQSYYPLQWLVFFMPVPVAETVIFILERMFSGLGAWFLLRRMSLDKSPALLGGMVYMLCAYNIVWLGHPHSSVSTWLPWICWSLLKIFSPHKESSMHLITSLTFFCALAFLAGHPGTILIVMFFSALFTMYLAVFQLWRTNSVQRVVKPVLLATGGLIVAFMISAPAIMPFQTVLRNESITQDQRRNMASNTPPLPAKSMAVALMPKLFGSPMGHDDQNIYNFHENAMFLGITPLVLCGIFILGAKRNRYGWFFLTSGFIIILSLLGVPPFYYLKDLPVLRHSVFQRNILLYQFAFAMTAAFGLQQLFTLPREYTLKKLVVSTLLLSVLAASLLFFVSTSRLREFLYLVGSLWACGFLVSCYLLGFGKKRVLAAGFILLAFLELYRALGSLNTYLKPEVASLDEPDIVRQLNTNSGGDWFRIASPDGTFRPNLTTLSGMHDTRGYDLPMLRRYVEFLMVAFYENRWDYDMIYWHNGPAITNEFHQSLWELLGVRYVLSNQRNLVEVQEFSSPSPEIFWAGPDIRKSTSMEQSLSSLRKGNFTLVETTQIPDSIGYGDHFEVLKKNVNGYTLEVRSSDYSLLVFNQVHAEGWKSDIDGKALEVFPVNFIQTGVWVPPGDHVLDLYYLPDELVFSWIISLTGLAVTFLLFGLGFKNRQPVSNDFSYAHLNDFA